jgi:hypothetical protein
MKYLSGVLLVLAWSTCLPVLAAESVPQTIELNRDIRPILSQACFQCHGPDKARRKADLRLDTEEGIHADLGDRRAVVPGKPEQSELIRRITSSNPRRRMPPPRSGKALSEQQIHMLRRWIEQGARWQPHWSLIPPRRPAVPAVRSSRWLRNPIDAFVLARLEKEGLTPAPEADRLTLLRRVSLDLTGLPPAPEEVDAFLADASPDAYERVVDRLLASPRYGERMAWPWLEAARYADTNGYQSDGERFQWRWRDWVIDAFNHNMPFDRFTTLQLAGDLLPHPTLEQRIATGFNRNHRGNGEGGIIPEEYAVEYVVDRVDTTATVWLGLTIGCARCHDHKFDPISQKDFYRLFAYFNNVPERGKAIKYGNSPPVLVAPTAAQQEKLRELDRQTDAARVQFEKLLPVAAAAQSVWERSAHRSTADGSIREGLIAHFPFDGHPQNRAGSAVQAQVRGGKAVYGSGRLGSALELDGSCYLDAGNVARFGFYDRFSCAAWVYPEGPEGGTILSRMVDAPQEEGYSIVLEKGRVHVRLVKRWLDDAIRVESKELLTPGRWHHVVVTYDGSRVADGIRIYLDGRPVAVQVNLDDLNQTFDTAQPLRIGAGGGPDGRFHGRLDDVRIYHLCLDPEEAAILSVAEPIADLAALPTSERSWQQRAKLRRYFLEQQAPPAVRQAYQHLRQLEQQKKQLADSLPAMMVMQEMPRPRDTFVLLRGEYTRPGEKVAPGIPASLTPPARMPADRLGLARWLVDPSNPLTARVAVNRYWQMYFGTGLVRTSEDLGAQGEWPSHPELLDWLAVEFIQSSWNVKALQRLIVTSATYRQSSRVSPALAEKDPDNRLLARASRLRLPAFAIRDQALVAGGLLVERLGGPSVRPYQPDSLWRELADTRYAQDSGPGLYRRSLYTFWKRTVAPPNMITLDAAGRETCIVRTARTNTPLQALILMNETTFVEAARALAQRVLGEAGPTSRERLTLAFRRVVARSPRSAELAVLEEGLQRHLLHFQEHPEAAQQLMGVGETPRDRSQDVRELAAYTVIASLLLNLDEAITRE